MNKDTIVNTVNKALSEEFELDINDMLPEARIREDLHLDSLDVVDMILALEQAFDFRLKDRSKVQNIETLQDIYDFIENQKEDGSICG